DVRLADQAGDIAVCEGPGDLARVEEGVIAAAHERGHRIGSGVNDRHLRERPSATNVTRDGGDVLAQQLPSDRCRLRRIASAVDRDQLYRASECTPVGVDVVDRGLDAGRVDLAGLGLQASQGSDKAYLDRLARRLLRGIRISP